SFQRLEPHPPTRREFFGLDGSPKRVKKFKDALNSIRRVVSPGSDFSGEMYNHVKKRREIDHPWLESLLG
ncbi:hypothetical protein, partial [Mesorhizobium sp.]|uniref:hypothetical protein n=1 Tax=Mesorhizobium sp. TaxID=1871066 RepID=UPI00257F26D1